MEAAPQIDYLKEVANNRWFVLGAYFFAFFPWAIMNNVDFISEKWRTCRRTRNLAHTHVASSIFPIIYVAVYAEAQRRDGDDKELGAALAALMFNVFQLLRTMMGIVQLNAFVAWCKHAVECMSALSRRDEEKSKQEVESREETQDEGAHSREESGERRSDGETRELNGLSQFKMIVARWQRVLKRIAAFVRGYCGNSEQNNSTDEASSETTFDTHVSSMYRGEEVDDHVEETIEVNNTVVDNELGGREVTVLPSWQKMWNGLKKGSFEPIVWLRTDQPMLNTVRWSGAFLCGMGGHWGIDKYGVRGDAELLEKFFSDEMYDLREVLQFVEWKIEVENGSCEILSIDGLGNEDERVELTGEMCAAYGTGCSYTPKSTWNVDLYSFEFSSLVGSYPAGETKFIGGNRECVTVGLAHSVILAKHLGVEKLKAIRQYYDDHQVPKGRTRENAFQLLNKQMSRRIADDTPIWMIFRSDVIKIPLFPYRMQAVALWEKAANWRVLQASAHADRWMSLRRPQTRSNENEERILDIARREVNTFDYCAEWTTQRIVGRGMLGVLIETARTFLAEWIVASAREPNWEPEVPKNWFEFGLGEIRVCLNYEEMGFTPLEDRLIWVCQRELQKLVTETRSEDENLPGNAAMVMLFMLGFPFLRMEKVQEAEICIQSQEEVHEESVSSSSNRERSVDVNVHVWRVSTALAPQDISLMLRLDLTKRTVSLRLRNSGSDGRFLWQDWVDAVMGYMKGAEERGDDDLGYGRQIMRPDLRKPIVELCPLRVDEDGIEAVVKKTKTARIWEGWPMFDVGICKFEMDQWLAACDVKVNRDSGFREREKTEYEVEQAEQEIERIVQAEREDVESSTQDSEI